jgi:hypothetical protein
MREHLEAINHQEAIEFYQNSIKRILLVKDVTPAYYHFTREFTEGSLTIALAITIKDKSFSPCEPAAIPRNRSAFNWYEQNKNSIHPIILAATVKRRLVRDPSFYK